MKSFLQHLEELRKRIIEYLISLAILIIVSFFFIGDLLKIWTRLIDTQLIMLAPQEGFLALMKVGMLSGFILSIPILLFQVWRFIKSALSKKEKSKVKFYAVISFLLFLMGSALAYFIILPLGLKVLINAGDKFFEPMISVSNYLSFITLIFIVFGIIFQLPLIVIFLNRIGIVNKKKLRDKRPYFYVAAFIVGAVLTPPDVITQIFLALPVIVLYEISMVLIT